MHHEVTHQPRLVLMNPLATIIPAFDGQTREMVYPQPIRTRCHARLVTMPNWPIRPLTAPGRTTLYNSRNGPLLHLSTLEVV